MEVMLGWNLWELPWESQDMHSVFDHFVLLYQNTTDWVIRKNRNLFLKSLEVEKSKIKLLRAAVCFQDGV